MTSDGDRRIDGRRARGDRRRAAIIAATLAVVERDGIAGVTHRRVASEAGVSTSSAVYYFATLDDLLVAALTEAAEDYARQFRELRSAGRDEIDCIAQLIADAGGAGRQRALAERELSLFAARRPALRPIARHWRDLVADVARRQTTDATTIDIVVALADGACAQVLLDEGVVTVDTIRAMLDHAIRGSQHP